MKLAVVSLASSIALFGCSHQSIAIDPLPPDFGGIDEPGFPGGGPVGPQPTFGSTVTASVRPAPLSGGTLAILHDGHTAVAADPDRDRVYIVDLKVQSVRPVPLQAGDEPGRLAEDAAGKVHVVARRGGVVVTIDPATGAITDRSAVCGAPRGIAYEAASDLLHVACAGGELVSLPAAGGAITRTLQLERDLRDVVISGGRLVISVFRTANLIVLDSASGLQVGRFTLRGNSDFGALMSASVAWRLRNLPDGRIAIAHQLGSTNAIETSPGGYGGGGGGGGCSSIVSTAFSIFDPTTLTVSEPTQVADTALGIDLVQPPHGQPLLMVAAGNAHTPQLLNVVQVTPQSTIPSPGDMGTPDMATGGGGCVFPGGVTASGEVTSVDVDGDGNVWVLSREPATLQQVMGAAANSSIALSADSRADTGFAIFHSNSGAGLACASCHPEGGDDARTWNFAAIGERRTQSLRGKISGTEPFHWNGDLPTFSSLIDEVYLSRMSGPFLGDDQRGALSSWIDSIPNLPNPAPADPAAVARGQALFLDTQTTGCVTCHAGPEHTNNQTVSVGTGGSFQVPRLVGIGWRAPYLHNGCAPTLTDRFGGCGGGDLHGVTSGLSPSQISDLVAYLNTL